MRRIEGIAVLMALAAATPAMAQGRGNAGVPPGQRPPAGMCRIWLDGVPPGRQPAPTSCAVAERYVPRNGRVIYGDNTIRNDRQIYTSGGGIYRNGQVYGQNSRVFPTGQVYGSNTRVFPNGQVYGNGTVYPNGQQCVQRAEPDGTVRTYCPGGDRDNDRYMDSRARRDMERRMAERAREERKATKDRHDDRDHDGDRDDWKRSDRSQARYDHRRD